MAFWANLGLAPWVAALVPSDSRKLPMPCPATALSWPSRQCSSAAKSHVLGSRNSVLYPLCWHFYTFGTVYSRIDFAITK
jgi:hypothetical protein